MKIRQMFNRVLLESGQFLIQPSKIELNEDRFAIVVRSTLGTYSRYSPNEVHMFKDLTGNRQFTFTKENTSEGVPDWLSDIIPIRILGTAHHFLQAGGITSTSRQASSPYLERKDNFPWEYRKPVLTIGINSELDIIAVYKHKLVSATEDGKIVFRVDTIDDCSDVFFNLLRARFLKALGRSRRAFTMQDLPITVDASELVSEGTDLEERVMEDLIENHGKFYLAWG